MSWQINSIGKVKDVRVVVEADPSVPAGAKAAILETIDDIASKPDYCLDGVSVQGCGHLGYSSPGSIVKLEVLPIQLAPPAPAVVEQEAA